MMEKVGEFEEILLRLECEEFQGLVLEMRFGPNSGRRRRGADLPLLTQFHDLPVDDADEDCSRSGRRGSLVDHLRVRGSGVALALVRVGSAPFPVHRWEGPRLVTLSATGGRDRGWGRAPHGSRWLARVGGDPEEGGQNPAPRDSRGTGLGRTARVEEERRGSST